MGKLELQYFKDLSLISASKGNIIKKLKKAGFSKNEIFLAINIKEGITTKTK